MTGILLDGVNTSFADQAYARQQVVRSSGRIASPINSKAPKVMAMLVLRRHSRTRPPPLLSQPLSMSTNNLATLPGRKNLTWISAGFPLQIGFLDTSSIRSFGAEHLPPRAECLARRKVSRRAVRLLNNSNLAIYPIDARGLMALPRCARRFSASIIKRYPGTRTTHWRTRLHQHERYRRRHSHGRRGLLGNIHPGPLSAKRQMDANGMGLRARVRKTSAGLDVMLRVDPTSMMLDPQGDRWVGRIDFLFVQKDDQGHKFPGWTTRSRRSCGVRTTKDCGRKACLSSAMTAIADPKAGGSAAMAASS